ncbi:MAG: hypothetical protein ABFR53_10450 [Actinomycetota bacterium]
MTDLRERFREQYEDVSVPDLWDRIETLAVAPSAAPLRAWPGFAVAIVAAATVALVVGGPLYLIGTRDSVEPATDPAQSAEVWRTKPVELPAHESIADMAELPIGGYAAVARDQEGVFWSPDGIDWYDIDPQRRMTVYKSIDAYETSPWERLVAGTTDRVVVMDRINPGVWVGDRMTGEWESIQLDVSHLSRHPDLLTIVSNDTDVLVVIRTRQGTGSETGYEDTEKIGFAAWVVDPVSGVSQIHPLPIPEDEDYAHDLSTGYAIGEWFDGKWHLAVTGGGQGTFLISRDGASWHEVEWPFSEPPDYWGSLMSVTSGPSSMIALVCYWGGDSFWYTADGVAWEQVTTGGGHKSTYVEGLGFVVMYESEISVSGVVSEDGRTWHSFVSQGATFGRYPGTSDERPVAVDNIFVFDSELWQWSRE